MAAFVTVPAPVIPEMVTGPVATSVNEGTVEAPPLVSVTVLTSVSRGAISLLLIVQVIFWPSAAVILLPDCEPPAQDQLPAA